MAAPPKVETDRPSDASEIFVGAGALLSPTLVARVGKPPFAPQLVVLHNGTAAPVTGTVVIDDDTGTSSAEFSIGAGATIPITTPVRNLNLATGITAFCYWWERGTMPLNQHTVAARNP